MMPARVYLVVEPIEIIATDLAMNVKEYDPSSTVLIAPSSEAACDAIEGENCVRFAFVHVDSSIFKTTNLARALVKRGAKIVYSGGFAEREDKDLLILERPFSAQTTAELLQRATGRKALDTESLLDVVAQQR
jgi:hypothetical protein